MRWKDIMTHVDVSAYCHLWAAAMRLFAVQRWNQPEKERWGHGVVSAVSETGSIIGNYNAGAPVEQTQIQLFSSFAGC
jgi:hypothetical protein